MTDIELYNAAKEAYYNGSPIMEDFEFDELEARLGLENRSYVGTRHNPAYTVQHPFVMGSLSKEQIHEKDGKIDWTSHLAKVQKYLNHSAAIITPKYDGCSFEVIYRNGKIVSISSRGDGEYGKDIRKHIESQAATALANVSDEYEFSFRGEVLINKKVFVDKYSEFVNPRSFVAGMLNRDYDETDSSIYSDLSIVIYDTRVNEEGNWTDVDWTLFSKSESNPYGYIDNKVLPQKYVVNAELEHPTVFENIYRTFEKYRNEICEYALDGIVIKPIASNRINNLTEHRPSDCIAIKFVPMLEETEVIDIEWSTRKTNELRPVIIVKPVTMDGKQVSRASAHNYGYLLDNKVSIGTKVILSLAGDIIPFIYKITDTDAFDINNLGLKPSMETYQEGCHLYKKLSEIEEKQLKFLASSTALNIPSLGPAATQTVFDYLVEHSEGDEFFDIPAKEVPDNILLVSSAEVSRAIDGKNGIKVKKSMDEVLKALTLKDIIISCTFEDCGSKVAEQIERFMLIGPDSADFTHLSKKAYEWCFNSNSLEHIKIRKIVESLGKDIEDFKKHAEETASEAESRIPVILTGEPNDYATKADFLKQHPEYRMTTSWKEVQIVFTNSLESTTGKMKKAKEKGIEIKLY